MRACSPPDDVLVVIEVLQEHDLSKGALWECRQLEGNNENVSKGHSVSDHLQTKHVRSFLT